MNTAREQAQAIMKERTTKEVKREKLLKIGLTENDISTLFFTERMIARQGLKAKAADRARRRFLASYTFGVEIECCNVRPDTIGIIASRRGLDMRHEGYNHTDHRSHYKLVPDGSLHGTDPIECVSPILGNTKQGFDSLKACCDTLNEAGARVNRSTGLHVHVGGNISERQYCNTFANYYRLEAVIDTFMAPSRRSGNTYCRPSKPSTEPTHTASDLQTQTATSARRSTSPASCKPSRNDTRTLRVSFTSDLPPTARSALRTATLSTTPRQAFGSPTTGCCPSPPTTI